MYSCLEGRQDVGRLGGHGYVLGMNDFYVEVTLLSQAFFMQSLDDHLSLVIQRNVLDI